jgi:hypothetical protein
LSIELGLIGSDGKVAPGWGRAGGSGASSVGGAIGGGAGASAKVSAD